MLQDDGVARHDRRHHTVDGDEVRIVPGGNRQHHAQRFAADKAREPGFWLGLHVGKGLRRDLDHVTRALFKAAHLAWDGTNGSPHLPGQFGRYFVGLGDKGIDKARTQGGPLGKGHMPPRCLRLRRLGEDGVNL
jgi:hypothetical protein